MSVTIDRCMCEQKTFASLVQIARASHLDLQALSAREGCGTHCGWCVAYLRRALGSEQVIFHELLPKEDL